MFYSQKDLEALAKNLADCTHYVERGREQYSPHLLTLLEARIKVCEEVLADLELNLSQLTPELTPKWEKLVSILRSLAGCNAKTKVSDIQCISQVYRTNRNDSFPMMKSTTITTSC
jgi:hypothetical protein